MHVVYIIKSINKNWFYVGLTKDPTKRLKRHNEGRVRSTKAYKPFELIFTKKFENGAEGRKYEKYLKIGSNKEKILRKLKK